MMDTNSKKEKGLKMFEIIAGAGNLRGAFV
jgi:hypothetical protein